MQRCFFLILQVIVLGLGLCYTVRQRLQLLETDMVDISVQKIEKAFEEGSNILDGVTFDINEGEHVALLGKNGAGKTTLFKIIAGELSEDKGDIVLAPGKKLGLISQIPVYPPDFTGEDVLRSAFSRVYELRKKMDMLETAMEKDSSEKLLDEYDRAASEFQSLGGYNLDFEVNRVVNGLGIPEKQRTQLFKTLSGGEKTRMNLARMILENTDILLLDEPTNHLDMNATEWLEEYVSSFKGTVLIISHDRYFLDRTVTRTVEILNGRAEFYKGNYSDYVVEKERRYEEQLKRYEKEQSEARRLQEAADRLYQWGTGNKRLMQKSFAIESRIERLVKTDRPEKERALGARFGALEFSADEAFSMKGISKSFDGRTLFSDLELIVKGGERIALLGDNGTGKSTLIKLIMGEMKPDTGYIKRGPSLKTAYLPQIIEFAHPERTLVDTLIYEDKCTPQTARNRLGAFKFSGEDVFKCVGDLSGGELSRLKMCMLMKDSINFLILDEPTNHLDIASREWIEDVVSEFEETLLFVSHDRYFINKFATRIWELADGTIHDFRGTYEQFRAYKASLAPVAEPKKPEEKKERHKSENAQKQKNSKSAAKKAAKLEREISSLEKEISDIEIEKENFATDYEKLLELDEKKAELEKCLEEKLAEWEEVAQ